MEVKVKGGVFAIPQGICVSCGGGPIAGSLVRGAMARHSRVSIAFPLCEVCNASLLRVKAARRPMMWKTRVLAIPLAAGICVLYALISGDVPTRDFATDSAWMHYLYIFVPVWYLGYRLMFRAFRDTGPGATDAPDRDRAKAIETSVGVSGGDGVTTFRFSNLKYGFTFETLNGLNLQRPGKVSWLHRQTG